MKPVRTFRVSLCFATVLAGLIVGDATAQQPSSRTRSVRQSERTARARWEPTRSSVDDQQPAARQDLAELPEPVRRTGRPPIRAVDHVHLDGARVLEDPIIADSTSIVEPPIQHAPLDGQIRLSPIHHDIACDALPAGECGCGDVLCDGGCESLGNCGSCSQGTCGVYGCSTCGELCSPEAWRPCVTLCVPQDGWVSFEYLGWWQDGMALPPLVTTSIDPNVPRGEAGVLTSSSTRVLFGGNDVLEDAFEGGRLRFGVWLDRCHTWAIGAEFFKIGNESEGFAATSTGNPVLARPFFNTTTGSDDSQLVAFPNALSGTVGALADSELVGASVHVKYLRCCDEGCSQWLFCGCPKHYCSRNEAMFGYRYLELDERVLVIEDLVSTDPTAPGTFNIFDRFDTRNQFNGVDLGWLYRSTRGYWTYDALLRMAIGNTRQTVTITGATVINDPNSTPQTQTHAGGLLAQTSNIGTFRQNEFAVVPEFGMNLGYQLTDHLRATLGYTFIYWSNVIRPGEQISLDVNDELIPPQQPPITGAQRPAFAFDTTDYWVQGISFGGEYRW